MDETALIRQAAAGDLEAFETLVRLKRDRVVRIAWHLVGDRELARDIAQDVFIRLYRVIGRFREGARFDTWLHRITLNLAIDALRRERPHRAAVALEAGIEPAAVPGAVGPGEIRRIFIELSAALPPKQRAAFLLREIEDLPTEEVAAILGTTASTVRNHVLQARHALKEALRSRYPEYCAARPKD